MHLCAPEGISHQWLYGQGRLHYPLRHHRWGSCYGVRHGIGCIMAKIDIKAAFCMVPIISEEWDILGLH